MMPVYIYRDSWPHQRNQTGNHKTFPAYIPMSPSKPQMVYEPWPHSDNYGYPNPMPCNSCCNHGSLPCFHGFRPSYPQPMPSPVHYCGSYPAPYPDPYPVYRVPPPPHYTAEMPRYEYDKNVPWNQNYHCCGCPNHQRGDGGVKIEEQEPDVVETKRNKPFVPIHMKGCPHPIVWIPEEYAKEQRRPSEEEEKKPESISPRMNQAKCVNPREQEPSIWNSWFPLDRDEIKYLMNNGEKMRTQDQKNEDQKKEYPCPVIWMPSYDHRWEEGGKKENKGVNVNGDQDQQNEEQMRQFPIPLIWMHPEDKKQNEGGDKDMNASPKLGENSPYVFKFDPMKHLGGDNSSENSNLSEEIIVGKDGTEVNEKTAARKVISVKQIDQPKEEEKKLKENEKHNETSKPSGTDSNRQSSLLTKSSKLPPVCLRVDPLPKKNGNGTSRSPSPRSKGCSRQNSNGTSGASTESALLDSKASTLSNKEVESKRRDTVEIVVTERTSHEPAVSVHSSGHTNAVVSENQTASEMAEERKLDKKTLPDVDVEPKKASDDPKVSVHSAVHTNTKVSEKQTVEKAGKDDDEYQTRDEMAETEKATDSSKSRDKNKPEKKILLDVDAALCIQSAYRGFEVRRSQPLKKLKQIAEVRDQVVDVRNHIQAMDSSSSVQENHKQKLVIGETIMRLLLKLDTIQGLHPSLRDIRKSLAKELVTLQEKLDSLVFEPEKGELEASPVGPVEEAEAESVECNQEMEGCPVGPVEEVAEAETVECKQEKQEETESDGSSDDARKSARDEVESGQDQLLPATDSEQSFKGEETSFCFSDDTVVHVVKGDDQEVQVDGDMKTEEPYLEHVVKGEDQDVQVEGDMRTEEPNSEATIEDRDEARTSSATKLVETVQGDKPPELEQAGEVSLQEDSNSNSNSDMPANSLEDTDVTCLHQNMETSIVKLSEEDIGAECVETKKDIEQVEMANGKEVESLAALEVSSPCEIEEAMAAEKEAKMKEVMATEKQAEIHELAELPIGAIDEDGLVDKENKCLKAIDTTLPESTTPNETEKPEAALEEKPIAKVKEEAEGGYEEKVDQCSISFETEESQPPISFEEEGSQNVLCEGEFVSENMETTKEVPIEKKEEADEHLQWVATEEAKEENQEMKVHVTDEKTNNKPNGPEITDDNVTDREKFTLLLAEQEGESLPLSPTCSQMSNDKSETGSKTNERLMEENEKLREMMEKLIEAGKRQLNVISDLNGRVKDLEKKLSKRNKKLRTRCGAVKDRAVAV